MLKHKLTWDEADRLGLKKNTLVGLVPYTPKKGMAKKYKVYLDGKLIAEDFILTPKEN